MKLTSIPTIEQPPKVPLEVIINKTPNFNPFTARNAYNKRRTFKLIQGGKK